MANFDRITSDPAMLNGQPCIRGLRITVRRLLEALAAYPDRDELRVEYPEIEDEEYIRQALEYAAANLEDRIVELLRDSMTCLQVRAQSKLICRQSCHSFNLAANRN